MHSRFRILALMGAASALRLDASRLTNPGYPWLGASQAKPELEMGRHSGWAFRMRMLNVSSSIHNGDFNHGPDGENRKSAQEGVASPSFSQV